MLSPLMFFQRRHQWRLKSAQEPVDRDEIIPLLDFLYNWNEFIREIRIRNEIIIKQLSMSPIWNLAVARLAFDLSSSLCSVRSYDVLYSD